MYSRDSSVINAYCEPSNIEDWSECPNCKQKPWVWIFDNGSYAKCCCSSKYDHSKGFVESESIGDVLRRTGGVLEYDRDNLRKIWNEYVLNTKTY